MIRNLIVHCYPRHSGMWRYTLRHLENAWDQFSGRKIITIAYDESCSDPDDVASEWPADCEIIIRPNVPRLQEVASFVPMLERIITESGITLYCHAKGATHADPNAASHKWRDAMAAACLEYPQLVDCTFASGKNIAGAFRSHGIWGFPGYHNWHFAGTWLWFRNSRAFELDWRNVHQSFEGVEAWPGLFPIEDGGCLFYDNADTAHLYSNEFWKKQITPSLAWWRKSLEKCGLRPISQEKLANRELTTVS